MQLSEFFSLRNSRFAACIAAATLLVSGCATPPPSTDAAAVAAYEQDPYEPFNRAMLDFNLALDKAVIRPAAWVYKEGIPAPLQVNIYNFLENLRSPVILANDVFQGEWDRAGNTLLRFAMNSTIGLLGINDFAGEVGIEKHKEDFGQTLAVWDVEAGPYLVLPIFGPSNPRDTVGLVVDILIDPMTWYGQNYGIYLAATAAVDRRARQFDELDELEENALDFYSTVKSAYGQLRENQIRNGATPAPSTPVPGRVGRQAGSVEEPSGDQQSQGSSTDK